MIGSLQTKLYKEDWIGLKTLDEAGKVKFINVSGNHLQISQSDMKSYMVPYLEEDQDSTRFTVIDSTSYDFFSSIWNFFMEVAGLSENQLLLPAIY